MNKDTNDKDLSLQDLRIKKDNLAEVIQRRLDIETYKSCTKEYREETRRYQSALRSVLKEIDNRYDEITQVNKLKYEYYEDIIKRERDKLVLSDDGIEMVEKFPTLVAPFDTELLGGGFLYSTFTVVAGESNSGKTDIVYMFIRGAIKQGLKIHLHSYETAYAGLYNGLTLKNKLRTDFDDSINQGIFSVDVYSKELKELVRMINIRATDGCRIFILDSLTKIRVNGQMATEKNLIDEVFETLRDLAHTKGLIIIGIGQKDKESKIENRNELYGSVMQNHIIDYLFFINYESREDLMTSRREIVMTKNRGQEMKKSIITDYDKENHTLFFVKDGNSIAGNQIEKNNNKIKNWIK